MGRSSPLIDAIFHRDFAKALKILKQDPHQVTIVDTTGWSALHWACVQAHSPLELIGELILAWPEALILQDRYGCTPLHDACLHSRSDIVNYLINASYGIETTRNSKGRTPLQHLCWYYRDKLESVLDEKTREQYKDSVDMIIGEKLTTLWCNATLLISAQLLSSANPCESLECSSMSLLHAATALGDQCPIELIALIITVAPTFVLQTDHKGNLPLHVASAAPNSNKVVRLLCQEQPWTAKVYNQSGKLPLHVAIENFNSCCIPTLIQAYPDSVQVADLSTGLMPFMLAASCGDVNLSFELLQMCPEVEHFAFAQNKSLSKSNPKRRQPHSCATNFECQPTSPKRQRFLCHI